MRVCGGFSLEFEQPEWLEQMAGILETLNEGVVIVDDCEHVIFVNACFEEMTGVSRDDILGKDPLLLYYGPEDAEFIRERRREVRAFGRTRHEFFLPTKDGTKLPVISSARNMEDPDGRTFTIVSFTDISEQKTAEEQLRAANKLLEERQKEIEEDLTLAARVQHLAGCRLHDHDLAAVHRRFELVGAAERLMASKHDWFTRWFYNRIRAYASQRPVWGAWPAIADRAPERPRRFHAWVLDRANRSYHQRLAPAFLSAWEEAGGPR